MKIEQFENNIKQYTIEKGKYQLKVLNIGAVITEFSINGKNIVLAYKDYNDYLTNTMYLGCVVGRTAGRIKNGEFHNYQLSKNFLGKHNLHGNNLHTRFYDVEEIENGVQLTLYDEEGEYPGNAHITIKYTLTNEGLVQEIFGESDKETLFNFTNHSYFNLNLNEDIKNLNLQIEADNVWSLCNESLPKELIDVKGSAFDFKTSKKISENLEISNEQFETTRFIDNPYKLNGNVILSNDEGLQLTIKTNQPYVVVYTGNYIGDEDVNFLNSNKFQRAGICLETQKVPGDITLVKDYYSKTVFELQ